MLNVLVTKYETSDKSCNPNVLALGFLIAMGHKQPEAELSTKHLEVKKSGIAVCKTHTFVCKIHHRLTI